MSPFEKNCYDFSIQVEKAAEAFLAEPSIEFNRIDCSLSQDLCTKLNVRNTPSILFFPAENVDYDNTFPDVPTADGIIRFINRIIGTHRIVDGGLDDEYGCDEALNVLSEEFSAV